MFGKRKIQKSGEQGKAVVLASDMSGYSNSHGINKWHLTLQVHLDDGSTVVAKCSAYPTGPVGAFLVGEIVPIRYDRDAMVAAKQAARKKDMEDMVRLSEERLARGGD